MTMMELYFPVLRFSLASDFFPTGQDKMEVEQQSVEYFKKCLQEDPDISVPLAAIKTLIRVIQISDTGTLSGLSDCLKSVIKQLKENAENSVTSITSGCELLLRFITLAAQDALLSKDFSTCKRVLVERGEFFLQQAENSRQKIAQLSQKFIQNGSVILTHSMSRVVVQLLLEAAKNKTFSVYVTESMPNSRGEDLHRLLTANNIPCTVILDSAVGYMMEHMDMVLLGAESVVESGGIINKIGSYQIAVMAKTMNKPVYVAAESFKFLREYPLKQKEVPNPFKYNTKEDGHPSVDYTPPSYIALLFTDLGVLTPSAVSDELIKLYL